MKKNTFNTAIIILIITVSLIMIIIGEKQKTITKNYNPELDSLIMSKKNEALFLSFWLNMSEGTFNYALQKENEAGNLKNGEYTIVIRHDYSTYSSTKSLPFTVRYNMDDNISLNFKDSKSTSNIDDKGYPREYGSSSIYEFRGLIDQIVSIYDEKYQKEAVPKNPVDNAMLEHFWSGTPIPWINYLWSGNEKIIALSYRIIYYSPKGWRYENVPIIGTNSFFKFDKRKKTSIIAWCEIKIRYTTRSIFYNKVHQIQLERERDKEWKKKSEIEKRQRILKEIDDSKKNL